MKRAMDLVAAMSGLQQSQITAQIQTAVAKKVMDVQEASGASALKLLDSAMSGVAKAGNAAAAAATGLGTQLDVYA